MNIAIFGVGALGSLFAAHLAPHNTVTLLGHWPEQLAALAAGALRLQRPDGSEESIPVRAVSTVEALRVRGIPDLILVVVKSYQTAEVAEACRRLMTSPGIHPRTVAAAAESYQTPLVLTLQNGLGNREILADAVGEENAALGITVQGATMVAPGVVRHGGAGLTTLANPAGDPRIEATAAAFNAVGLETRTVASGDALLWGKLAVNAAINPLAALLGVENGALLEPPLRPWVAAAAEEVAAVAAAQGIALRSASERALDVCRDTAANRASMLQDLDRGRPTEIDAICGAVAARGRDLGIPTPINTLYWLRIRAASGQPVPESSALDFAAGATLGRDRARELDTLIDHARHRSH